MGLRTIRPNEAWHIDATVIRLLDGTKVYLHAVIDNFSRRILAWKVAEKLKPATTCEILVAAAREARIVSSGTPTVYGPPRQRSTLPQRPSGLGQVRTAAAPA